MDSTGMPLVLEELGRSEKKSPCFAERAHFEIAAESRLPRYRRVLLLARSRNAWSLHTGAGNVKSRNSIICGMVRKTENSTNVRFGKIWRGAFMIAAVVSRVSQHFYISLSLGNSVMYYPWCITKLL